MRLSAAIVALSACLASFADAPSDALPAPRPDATAAMARTLKGASISGSVLESLEQFRKLAGVRVELNVSALLDTGIKPADRASVKVEGATASQVLDMLLVRLAKPGKPLGWYAEGDTVHVTTQAEVFRHRRPSSVTPGGSPTRTARRPAPAATTPAPAAEAARGAAPREVSFDEMPLQDVLDRIRQQVGLNIHVNWASLETLGVDRDKPISLKGKGLSLRQVLNLITAQLAGGGDKLQRVYWVVDGGIVTIASGEALNTTLKTQVFDVADLLAVAPNFQAPDGLDTSVNNNGQNSGSGTGQGIFASDDSGSDNNNRDNDDQDVSALRQARRDTLVAIIQESIGPDMWQPIGKGSIRLLGNNLVISQTPLGFKLLQEAGRAR